MRSRTGEKVGWVVGWLGGFLWLGILSVVWLVQGKTSGGMIGLGLFAAAVAAIGLVTPWRFPKTPFWKLLLVPYTILFAAAAWAIQVCGGLAEAGVHPTHLLGAIPLLLPFLTAGRRRWEDGEGPQQGPTR